MPHIAAHRRNDAHDEAGTWRVWGEAGLQDLSLPPCKRFRTLKRLPPGFKCADLICDFCGFLGQVKTCTVEKIEVCQEAARSGMGATKGKDGVRIYFPLFVVAATQESKKFAIYYLSADLQLPELFFARNPLSASARRAGWCGFLYDLGTVKDRLVRLV